LSTRFARPPEQPTIQPSPAVQAQQAQAVLPSQGRADETVDVINRKLQSGTPLTTREAAFLGRYHPAEAQKYAGVQRINQKLSGGTPLSTRETAYMAKHYPEQARQYAKALQKPMETPKLDMREVGRTARYEPWKLYGMTKAEYNAALTSEYSKQTKQLASTARGQPWTLYGMTQKEYQAWKEPKAVWSPAPAYYSRQAQLQAQASKGGAWIPPAVRSFGLLGDIGTNKMVTRFPMQIAEMAMGKPVEATPDFFSSNVSLVDKARYLIGAGITTVAATAGYTYLAAAVGTGIGAIKAKLGIGDKPRVISVSQNIVDVPDTGYAAPRTMSEKVLGLPKLESPYLVKGLKGFEAEAAAWELGSKATLLDPIGTGLLEPSEAWTPSSIMPFIPKPELTARAGLVSSGLQLPNLSGLTGISGAVLSGAREPSRVTRQDSLFMLNQQTKIIPVQRLVPESSMRMGLSGAMANVLGVSTRTRLATLTEQRAIQLQGQGQIQQQRQVQEQQPIHVQQGELSQQPPLFDSDAMMRKLIGEKPSRTKQVRVGRYERDWLNWTPEQMMKRMVGVGHVERRKKRK